MHSGPSVPDSADGFIEQGSSGTRDRAGPTADDAGGAFARAISPAPWHIITGEYDPAPGGVADYARSVAIGLARRGDEVHVWSPPPPDGSPLASDPGVLVHALPHGFGPVGLAQLAAHFRKVPPPRRVLVQYVPQAFGFRGTNIPFCAWLRTLRQAEVWVMFHEVIVPWGPAPRWKQNLIAGATRVMARLVVDRADRVFVSVLSWNTRLRAISPSCIETTWLPVPSNVPVVVPEAARSEARSRIAGRSDARLIGHIGNNRHTAGLVTDVMRSVLERDPRRFAVLIGRGGEAIARDLLRNPALAGRVAATGEMTPPELAAHLAACDVLLQPYGDGASGRRTSLMAGLALGVPIVTNVGAQTEPIWVESDAVSIARTNDALAPAVERVLDETGLSKRLGERGAALYREKFSIDRVVETLRSRPLG
jgi:glycosyltransferase involved in cell wall biosynthesis